MEMMDIEALALMARDAPDRLTLAQIKELAGAVLIREAMRGRIVIDGNSSLARGFLEGEALQAAMSMSL